MKKLSVFALISTLSTGTFAHSHVDITTFENGAVIADVAIGNSLNYATESQRTRVEMTQQDHAPFRHDIRGQASLDQSFTLPRQKMAETATPTGRLALPNRGIL